MITILSKYIHLPEEPSTGTNKVLSDLIILVYGDELDYTFLKFCHQTDSKT